MVTVKRPTARLLPPLLFVIALMMAGVFAIALVIYRILSWSGGNDGNRKVALVAASVIMAAIVVLALLYATVVLPLWLRKWRRYSPPTDAAGKTVRTQMGSESGEGPVGPKTESVFGVIEPEILGSDPAHVEAKRRFKARARSSRS
jgi:hypothetical protein